MHAAIQKGKQIIGDDALNGVFVAELQPDPQSIQLRSGEKGFALGLEIISELAHEINTPNFFHCKIPLLPLGREQFKCLRIAELARVQVAAQDVAIEESHDDFLVG